MKTTCLLAAVLSSPSPITPKLTVTVAVAPKWPTQPTPQQSSKRFWHDRLTGRRYPLPDSIGGRPVASYLADARVSGLAKALYTGHFRPSDTDSTARLLALATTTNKKIRPFYRWCLEFTILLSDGALGDYAGKPALAYAIRYPQEFFVYMSKDASGQRYTRWVELMAYSGLTDYYTSAVTIKKELVAQLRANCQRCSPRTDKRINALAADIAAVAKRNDR
jgi:hypothetical protein